MLNWMANLIQNPGEKMVVTPIVKGPQGSGKGLPIQKLADIIGPASFYSTTKLSDVLEKFQDEKCRTNVFTLLDECTYAGNHKEASQLKGLISSSTRSWEVKFGSKITLPNYSKLILTSNYDSMACVDPKERRFLCLEMAEGDELDNSREYFNTLVSIDPKYFAYYLYNRDLTDFKPLDMPATQYQQYQQILNAPSSTIWLEDAIKVGRFDNVIGGAHILSETEHTEISIDVTVLMTSYTNFASAASYRYKNVSSQRDIAKYLSGLTGITKDRKMVDRKRQLHFVFPTIDTMKKSFEKHMGSSNWNWD
jgi:hypothetical protein